MLMSIENNGSGTPSQEVSNSQVVAEQADVEQVDSGVEGEASEVLAEAEDILADPNASKQEKVAAKKMLRSLKIKVDGKEYNEELPFEIEDDPKKVEWMQRQLQLAKVSQKRMQEKSEVESEVRDFLELLRTNPEEILTSPHINIDLKKFAAKIIEQELENEKKSPAELKAEKLEKELKAMKDSQDKEKESTKKREMERIQQEAYDRYEVMLDQAFTKNPDIPKSSYFVKRISDYMLLGLQNGMDVNPEDVIPLIREERKKELQEMFGSSSDDVLEELLGKERISGLRKKAVAKAKEMKVAPKVVDTGSSANKKAEEPVKKTTIKDFFKV